MFFCTSLALSITFETPLVHACALFMSLLILSLMYNSFVYLTFHELAVRVPSLPVNILVVYLFPKQVVVVHSVTRK